MIAQSTLQYSSSGKLKFLVYGQGKVGKTYITHTLPKPFVVSAEKRLVSLSKHDVGYCLVDTEDDCVEAYNWLKKSPEAKQYESVAIDSVTTISEFILESSIKTNKDVRQAYQDTKNRVMKMIRKFSSLDKHVYFIAQLDKVTDEMGRMHYGPSAAGQALPRALEHMFDLHMALRPNPELKAEHKVELLCWSDGLWSAGDSSGQLAPTEPPDLGKIISKILK